MTPTIFFRKRLAYFIGCVFVALACAVTMTPGTATAG
jgi:hypothetical protein